jgi:hypothetical protein
MKSVLMATTCTIMAAGLHAQIPAEPNTKAASINTQPSSSNEERNTRAYIELLRTDIRKSKSQVMGEVMRLDTDDSQKFWPIYKEFETELTKIGNQVVTVLRVYVENYSNMTDVMADELANKVLNIEQQRNALKKKYYDRVKNSMGAVMAMRFLQVENQLERLLDLQLAAQLPVDSQ